MAYKILTGTAQLGGSIQLQKDLVARAATDLESKLNSDGVDEVITSGAYESAHDVTLFAIVKFTEPKKKKSSDKGE